jgi:hypothetical protein
VPISLRYRQILTVHNLHQTQFRPKSVTGFTQGLSDRLSFEIKDLTYNAQFNFCLPSSRPFAGMV